MFQPKPLAEQTLVITGASSGIGRATARCAAEKGARVVLVARNEGSLATAVHEIVSRGGRAIAVTADVSDAAQVALVGERALETFGGVDTWVNNAGVSMYGKLEEVPLEDMRRQFDVNFWGAVHGSLTAVRLMRQSGGVLINVASVLADRAVPLQGIYCASKHAMKAFSDSLRMEVEESLTPVAVCLVKPSSMATPFFEKARTLLEHEPQPIPPVYDPEVTAKVIVQLAEKPKRDVTVGGAGKALAFANALTKRGTDRFQEKKHFDAQESDIPVLDDRDDNLYWAVADDGGEVGRNWMGRTKRSSLYTYAVMHPGRVASGMALLGLGLTALMGWQGRRARH